MADTLSLKEAVMIALENNYAIKIARLDEQKANNNEKLKYGAMLPIVRADGSLSHTYSDNNSIPTLPSTNIDNTSTVYTAGVAGNWTLFDGFRMFYAFKQVEQSGDLTRQASRFSIEASVAAVITAYYNLLAAEALLQVAQDQLTLSKQLLLQQKNRYDFGGATEQILLLQQVIVNSDSSQVNARLFDLIQARHSLNVALGNPPNAAINILSDTIVEAPTQRASYWFDLAKKHNAGLQIAQIKQNIAATDLGIAKASFWPMLTANGSYSQSFGDTEQERASVGLNLTWQLFNGFRTLTTRQNAQLTVKSNELSVALELKELESLIYAQWNRRQNAFNQLEFEQEAQKLAKKSLAISKEKYTLGGISSLQLREAQVALIQSQVRFQTALFQYKISRVQLQQLAGVLKINH